MQNCKRFLKQEPVFVIAAVCAVVSMLWVPPSAQYLEYIDLRVLELLFCLMAAVAGMQQEGPFWCCPSGCWQAGKAAAC